MRRIWLVPALTGATVADVTKLLDLGRFVDRETSLTLAAANISKYDDLAGKALRPGDLYNCQLWFMAVLTRARGLHEAAVREIRMDCPHSAFILIRGYLEALTLQLYVGRSPSHIPTLLEGKGGKKSFQAMFDAVSPDAPGLRNLYRELSEMAHFGQLGIYNVFNMDDERSFNWTTISRWRREEEFKAACAHIEELSNAMLAALQLFAVQHCRGFQHGHRNLPKKERWLTAPRRGPVASASQEPGQRYYTGC